MTPNQALQLTDRWEIKQALRMAYVLEHYGHHPEYADGGKLHYVSPFRQDTRPSLDVFSLQIKNRPAPEERFGDFADPDLPQGDVFDLIGKLEQETSQPRISDIARELLAAQLESEWAGPKVEARERKPLDHEEIVEKISLALPLHASPQNWWDTVRERPALLDAVLPQERVFVDSSDTICFVLRDEDDNVRGLRYRWADGRKSAMSGTVNILMRLEPPSTKPVILTEGETDTWSAWAHLHEEYEVLGVPGVGNHPEKVAGDYLDGREVTIMFDPDTAGRNGATAWRNFLQDRGCMVRIAVLPSGKDVSQLSSEQVRALPGRSRVLPPNTDRLYRQGAQFVWVANKNGDTEAVSNWSFEPRSVLTGEDGVRSYEGLLLPLNRSVVLPAIALTNQTQLMNWGAPYQARWTGNNAQVQHLAILIDHEAAFLPEGRLTSQVGLHEGSFVWHNGSLGSEQVFYAPPATSIGINDSHISLPDDPVDTTAVFRALYQLQHPAVMGPILAWLAVAPLRSRFREFPILSIAGASGSGKTALSELVTRIVNGSEISTNLTSTTPHGVAAFIAASNGFVVRFDEYRPGAREDAKEALDQTLRDAYTGQVSAKGGQNRSNLNQVNLIRTDAPIMVTGEDDFTETSHTDRMVLVRLLQAEQGNIGALKGLSAAGFARAYLTSLLRSGVGVDRAPVHESYQPTPLPGLRPRPAMNAAVLQQGWWLLESFLTEHDPSFVMPDLDLERVVEAGETAGATDPVMEAVQYCYENEASLLGPTAVWTDDEFLYVSASNLLGNLRQIPGVVLPATSAKGITGILSDKYGADTGRFRQTVRGQRTQKQVRASRIPLSALEWLSDDERTSHVEHPPEV